MNNYCYLKSSHVVFFLYNSSFYFRSKKKEKKKVELVIPLITKNEWRSDMDRRAVEAELATNLTRNKSSQKQLSLNDQAIQELLAGKNTSLKK